MDLNNSDYTDPPELSADALKAQLLVNKQDVIEALQGLVDQYPSDDIPLEAVENTLRQFIGSHHLGRLSNNPAIDRLDQVLSQYRNSRQT